MPLKGEAKRLYQREYMRGYMRQFRLGLRVACRRPETPLSVSLPRGLNSVEAPLYTGCVKTLAARAPRRVKTQPYSRERVAWMTWAELKDAAYLELMAQARKRLTPAQRAVDSIRYPNQQGYTLHRDSFGHHYHLVNMATGQMGLGTAGSYRQTPTTRVISGPVEQCGTRIAALEQRVLCLEVDAIAKGVEHGNISTTGKQARGVAYLQHTAGMEGSTGDTASRYALREKASTLLGKATPDTSDLAIGRMQWDSWVRQVAKQTWAIPSSKAATAKEREHRKPLIVETIKAYVKGGGLYGGASQTNSWRWRRCERRPVFRGGL